MATRQQNREAKERKYKAVVADLRKVITKHGREAVRWAMNRWTQTEAKRKRLTAQKAEIEKELNQL